ncbi:MAG: hypothetical protein ACYC56_13895, partial [Candidatus Aquicultor sp.]
GDDRRTRHHHPVVFDQKRRLPGRIEQQVVLPALERLFFDQLRVNAIFPQKKPDETRLRAERMVMKRDHSHQAAGGKRRRYGAAEAGSGV